MSHVNLLNEGNKVTIKWPSNLHNGRGSYSLDYCGNNREAQVIYEVKGYNGTWIIYDVRGCLSIHISYTLPKTSPEVLRRRISLI